MTLQPKYKCPECSCEVGVRIWTNQHHGEYLVACVKCGARIKEFVKEERK